MCNHILWSTCGNAQLSAKNMPDKYQLKIIQKIIDEKEEELIKCRLAREFLKQHNDLDAGGLMQGIDPSLGLEELKAKIKSLELFLDFLYELNI